MSKRQMWARLTNHAACPSRASPTARTHGRGVILSPLVTRNSDIEKLESLHVFVNTVDDQNVFIFNIETSQTQTFKVDLSLLLVK